MGALLPFPFPYGGTGFWDASFKSLSGWFVGGFPRRDGILISHLQFAYDTLIICKNSCNPMRHLWCVIRCFEVVSRLHVNLYKSRIFGVGQVSNLRRLTKVIGCQVDSLPTSYLGLPLSSCFKCKEVGEKITFIKSVLASFRCTSFPSHYSCLGGGYD